MVNTRRGQAMVEFALIGPLLMLLLLVLLDFGRGLFYYSELSAGAREGARQAVLQSNWMSNTSVPACNSTAPRLCSTPGVVPQIQKVASFGLPIVYADSTSASSGPWYLGSYTSNGANQPGTITLAANAQPNTVYVFIYQIGNPALPEGATTSPEPYWPCVSGPGCEGARTGNQQKVVVDLKMNFQPTVLSLAGIKPAIALDAQSVQVLEYQVVAS